MAVLGPSNDFYYPDPTTGGYSPGYWLPGTDLETGSADYFHQSANTTLSQLQQMAGPDWAPKFTGDYGNIISNSPDSQWWIRDSYQPPANNISSFTGDYLLPSAFFYGMSAGVGASGADPVAGYGGAGDVATTSGNVFQGGSGLSASQALWGVNTVGQLSAGINPIQSQVDMLEAIAHNPKLAITSFGVPAAFNADWSADTTRRKAQPMEFDDFSDNYGGGPQMPQGIPLDNMGAIPPDNSWMTSGAVMPGDSSWMGGGDPAMMSLLGLDNYAGGDNGVGGGGVGSWESFSPSGGTGPTPTSSGGVNLWNGTTAEDLMKKFGLNKGSTWSTGLNTFSGLYGMYMANRARQDAQRARMASDPFAGERGIYQKQLRDLSNDPSSITKIPGYDAGIQAIQRGLAASGQLSARNKLSGAHLIALQKYGGDFYNQQMQRLMTLSGGTQSAGYAGLNLQHGDQFATEMASKALATLGYTLRTA